jgi:hypothetical protein
VKGGRGTGRCDLGMDKPVDEDEHSSAHSRIAG